jgi:hypothetical protein
MGGRLRVPLRSSIEFIDSARFEVICPYRGQGNTYVAQSLCSMPLM